MAWASDHLCSWTHPCRALCPEGSNLIQAHRSVWQQIQNWHLSSSFWDSRNWIVPKAQQRVSAHPSWAAWMKCGYKAHEQRQIWSILTSKAAASHTELKHSLACVHWQIANCSKNNGTARGKKRQINKIKLILMAWNSCNSWISLYSIYHPLRVWVLFPLILGRSFEKHSNSFLSRKEKPHLHCIFLRLTIQGQALERNCSGEIFF